MLARRFVSSKSRGGFDDNELEKTCILLKKNKCLKEKQNSDTACWFTEKTKFNTKNNHFGKPHHSEKCKMGNPLGFLKIQFVAKHQIN